MVLKISGIFIVIYLRKKYIVRTPLRHLENNLAFGCRN